jgi:CRISPR-associated protein Csm2
MVEFWKDREKKTIDPDLFSEKADALAKKINEARKKSNKNAPTQIRRFYDEVLRFAALADSNKNFDELLPYVKMMNAKAAYAVGRDLVSPEFKDFISGAVAQIRTREDLKLFASFFEAMMGFYKFYNPSENKGGRV